MSMLMPELSVQDQNILILQNYLLIHAKNGARMMSSFNFKVINVTVHSLNIAAETVAEKQ